ncbi:MAG: hypothetical protein FJ279_36980 [Planctomycetes bacterium]|nr:hypothetical protein [Planctomycetota bacterium]
MSSMTVSIDAAERDLKNLVDQLHLGETVTLLGAEGSPVAVLVSLKSDPAKGKVAADWLKGWEELAKQVGRAWKGDKSAVEVVSEMRR